MVFIKSMENFECQSCHKPKASLECGLCSSAICKNCAQFNDEDQFSFLAEIPQELSHSTYCVSCFDEKVAPALAQYNETMELAKDVLVYSKTQTKETRLIKRKEQPVHVVGCKDHDETILRLAFLAAKAGHNGIIDVQLSSEKIKNGSYQTMRWSGTGIPAHIDSKKIPRDRSLWQNPN